MDCWLHVPSVGRILSQINSGGTHESVHRSKSAFQRLIYIYIYVYIYINKNLFSLVRGCHVVEIVH